LLLTLKQDSGSPGIPVIISAVFRGFCGCHILLNLIKQPACTWVYQKVPRLDLQTRMYLLYLSLGSTPFKIVPLCSDTPNPAPRYHCWKRVLKSWSRSVTRAFCDSRWISFAVSKQRPFSCSFNFGKRSQNSPSNCVTSRLVRC
jgi:hypothetical protein